MSQLGVALLLGFLAVLSPARAQVLVSGTVKATDGTPLPGVRVEFMEAESGDQFLSITNGEGRYQVDLAPTGTAVEEEYGSSLLPAVLALYPNYPNPFNPSTTIAYELPRSATVELGIYNTLGHRVRTLVRTGQAVGRHTVVWDGRDDRGEGVAAGVYVYRLTAGSEVRSRKLLLVDGAYSAGDGAGVREPAGKVAESRVYTVRVSSLRIVERVIEEVAIAQSMTFDIPDIQLQPSQSSLSANDTDGDGRTDEIKLIDPGQGQEVSLKDQDADGVLDALEQTREYGTQEGAVVTQRTQIAESEFGNVATSSFTLESSTRGSATLNFSTRPQRAVVSGLGSGGSVQVAASVEDITPRILELTDAFARIEIPKSMATHIDEISFAGDAAIEVIDPDPMFVWRFKKSANAKILSSQYEATDDHLSFTYEVGTNLVLGVDDIRLEVRATDATWELVPSIKELGHRKLSFWERSVSDEEDYRYAVEAQWLPPRAGTYELSLEILGPDREGPSQGVLARELKYVVVFGSDPPPPTTGGPELVATLPGGASMEFVWIAPGTFTMGSPSSEQGRDSDEGPQHQVTISRGFYLGKYEITQGQWEGVMGTRPWSGQSYVQENPNNPAVYISWDDVQAFVHKLNDAAGDSLYRLPTEAEWEYACRAGTTTRWSFGDNESQLKDYAWYFDNAWAVGLEYAQPVGTKQPNPWGLYDMHGNVWEWCQDWVGYYSSSSQTDPTGPSSRSFPVLRGGNFKDDAQSTRSAYRIVIWPGSRIGGLGARLLRVK